MLKKKLKEVYSLLDDKVDFESLSSPIEELCKIVTYVSGVECEERYLSYFVSLLKGKNPSWYSTAVSLFRAKADPDTDVFFGKCSLKQREYKKAKKREHRTPFHVNIPDSIYKSITEPVKRNLELMRKNEKAGILSGSEKLLCVFVPIGSEDFVLSKINESIEGWKSNQKPF